MFRASSVTTPTTEWISWAELMRAGHLGELLKLEGSPPRRHLALSPLGDVPRRARHGFHGPVGARTGTKMYLVDRVPKAPVYGVSSCTWLFVAMTC